MNLCETFHLAPEVVENMDAQTVYDWITILTTRNRVNESKQKEPPK